MPRSKSDALEVPDQQQPKIDTGWHTGTAHGLGVKASALRFNEIVEPVLSQQLIDTPVEGVARRRGQLRRWDPTSSAADRACVLPIDMREV